MQAQSTPSIQIVGLPNSGELDEHQDYDFQVRARNLNEDSEYILNIKALPRGVIGFRDEPDPDSKEPPPPIEERTHGEDCGIWLKGSERYNSRQWIDWEVTLRACNTGTAELTADLLRRSEIFDDIYVIDATDTYDAIVGGSGSPPTITGLPPSDLNHPENSLAVGIYTATDSDGDDVMWSLRGADSARFTIVQNSNGDGELSFRSAPNFENPTDTDSDNIYEVTVVATDDSSLSLSSSHSDEIMVLDVNEQPVVSMRSYSYEVAEDAPIRTTVGTVSATDPDNDTIVYSITAGNTDSKFTVHRTLGAITVAAALDRSVTSLYSLTLRASDGNLHDEATVHITVTPPSLIKLAPPRELTIVPLPNRKVKLSWMEVTDAPASYIVRVEERIGMSLIYRGIFNDPLDTDTSVEIDLDAILSDQGLADLEDGRAYTFSVKAVPLSGSNYDESDYSSGVELRDIPMTVDGVVSGGGAEVRFAAIGERNVTYELHWRKLEEGITRAYRQNRIIGPDRLEGDTGWAEWRPSGSGTWPHSDTVTPSTPNTIAIPDDDAIYAFRLTYHYGGTEGFSAQEYYGWSRPASDHFPGEQVRVATYPFYGHWPTPSSGGAPPTYRYVFCDETVPGTPTTDENWQALIDSAAAQWVDSVAPDGLRDEAFVSLAASSAPCQIVPQHPRGFVESERNPVNEIFMFSPSASDPRFIDELRHDFDPYQRLSCRPKPMPTSVDYLSCVFKILTADSFASEGTLLCALTSEACAVSLNLSYPQHGHAGIRLASSVAHPPSVDIVINQDRFNERLGTIDIPESIRFNTCNGEGNYTTFRTMLHELGHALGIGSFRRDFVHSSGHIVPMPHATIPQSVLNEPETGESDCAPYPLDVLALQALYQGVQ